MEDTSYLDGDESQLDGDREFRPQMEITVDADFDNPVDAGFVNPVDSLIRANSINKKTDAFFSIPKVREPSTLTPADLVKFVGE